MLYGDETLSTSLCYVTDTVDGLVRLMAAEPKVKVANLGGDQIYKYIDIANMIIQMTDSKTKVVFDKPLAFLTKKGMPDLHYTKDMLGWFPLVRLEDGLRKTVDYAIAHRESLVLK